MVPVLVPARWVSKWSVRIGFPAAASVVSMRPDTTRQSCNRFAQKSGPTHVLVACSEKVAENCEESGWHPDNVNSVEKKRTARGKRKRGN